jgi:hypothetical protein
MGILGISYSQLTLIGYYHTICSGHHKMNHRLKTCTLIFIMAIGLLPLLACREIAPLETTAGNFNSPAAYTTASTSTASPTGTDDNLSYIQVSTGLSIETTDPINQGIPVKISCFNARNENLLIDKKNGEFVIKLFNVLNEEVFQARIIANYLPDPVWNYVFWIPFYKFVPESPYPFTRFEGKIKLTATLPGQAPVEAANNVGLYLLDNEPISQKKYMAFEKAVETPPPVKGPPFFGNRDVDYVYPVNGSKNIPAHPIFTWEHSTNFDSYNFVIGSNPNITEIIDSRNWIPNIYRLPVQLKNGSDYFWKRQSIQRNFTGRWVNYNFSVGH